MERRRVGRRQRLELDAAHLERDAVVQVLAKGPILLECQGLHLLFT